MSFYDNSAKAMNKRIQIAFDGWKKSQGQKPMTLHDAMNEVAIADGHETGWNQDYEFRLNMTSLKLMMTKAAELYAKSCASLAWDAGFGVTNERYNKEMVYDYETIDKSKVEADKETYMTNLFEK